jgi:glycosyltransferase involved in cell wall biosynthesis
MWRSSEFTISIVVPCFNKAKYVRQSLLSILEQDCERIEIIFVDGSSSDGSIAVANEVFGSDLAARRVASGWRIIKIVEADKGQSHAINKGLLEARGEIVCWLNADDFYYSGALERVRSLFREEMEVGMIYGGLDFIAEDGSLVRSRRTRKWDRHELLDSYCYIPQPSTFWRRSLIAEVGLIDTRLHFAMDYDYWLRLSLFTRVKSTDYTLAGIRIMEGTKTGMTPLNAMPEALQVARNHGARYFSKFRFAYWLWRIGAEDVVRYAAAKLSW